MTNTFTKDDKQRLAAEIDLGIHDGSLGDLFNAIRRRLGEQMVALQWRVTIADKMGQQCSFTLADMSLNSMALAEELGARSWKTLDPEHSAVEFKAITVAHLTADRGWTDAQVIAAIGAMSMDDLVAAISFDEVTPSPFATSAP